MINEARKAQVRLTHVDKTESVDGPEAPVGNGFPDHANVQPFSVMHVGLGRIIAKNPEGVNEPTGARRSTYWKGGIPVDHDHFLSFIEPSFRPVPVLRLSRPRRHHVE